jgi:membrane-bound lytic murein transglycosylase B
MNKFSNKILLLLLGIFALGSPMLISHAAAAEQSFAEWLAAFRQDALDAGISAPTLDAAFADIVPLPRVVEHDRSQPEFIRTFTHYLNQRLTPQRIARGQQLLQQEQALFDEVEQRYGVPRAVLAAFWGLETNYGATKGNYYIPTALATLAYEGRRHDFFRAQLLDAMRILDAKHVPPDTMRGSWAGAMGHMQFMPSTFLAYAVDGDGDNRINLWQSLPDAMHSAAHYLKSLGWRSGEPAAVEVQLPADFDWQQAQLMRRESPAYWAEQGVKPMSGDTLPEVAGVAAIVLPQGWQGPALMVFENFHVIMQWNRSVNYALSVALLAERLNGAGPLIGGANAEQGALSLDQMKTLQQRLVEHGFDAGAADGYPGLRTQAAIRQYQQAHALPMDGYASPSLLEHLQCCAESTAKTEEPAVKEPAVKESAAN